MINYDSILTYIKAVVKKHPELDFDTALMGFMCQCFELVVRNESIPDVGVQGLKIAKAYWWEGKLCGEDLENARINCWRFLRNKGSGDKIKDNEDILLRALLSIMFQEPFESDDFTTDALGWFVDMLNRLGDYSKQVGALMKLEGNHSKA